MALLLIFILGAFVGNIINILIDYLPFRIQEIWHADCYAYTKNNFNIVPSPYFYSWKNISLRCRKCKNFFPKWIVLPFIRTLITHETCLYCKNTLSRKYLFVELSSCVISVLFIYRFGLHETSVIQLVFIWGLLLIAVIDFCYYLLPDCINFSLLWLGLLNNAFGLYVPISESIIGAIAGYLFLLSIGSIFRYLRKTEGIGRGDFKLLAALGAWHGVYSLAYLVFFASLFGTLLGIVQIFFKKQNRNAPIAFGSCLALASILMSYLGVNNA